MTPIPPKRYRLNSQIRVPQVTVIDDKNEHLGVMETTAALALAQERGLDLVEVGPMSQPPVCKILDFGAFLFRQEKQLRKAKAKQKKVDLKGIRLTFGIGQHDRDRLQVQTLKFLEEGHKVQLEMRLRGRQNAHRELARKGVLQFISDLGDRVTVEQALSVLGNRITAIVGKKH